MYKDMPASPGILWTKKKNHFSKSVMMPGVSLVSLQWLTDIQESNLCVDKEGHRVQIEHAYHRGEKIIGNWKWDGFFIRDGKKFFLEFNGCRFHSCPCNNNSDPVELERNERKKKYAESNGVFLCQTECKYKVKKRETPTFPQIMFKSESSDDLLSHILNERVFGFVQCDVDPPKGKSVSNYKYLNRFRKIKPSLPSRHQKVESSKTFTLKVSTNKIRR